MQKKVPGPGCNLNPSHMQSRHVLREPHHSCWKCTYYTENVESLPHFSDPYFLWSAIQLSKTSSTKSRLTMEINSKVEGLNYWLSHCNGVEKCEECDHFLPKSYSKNNCKEHPEADLITTEGCPVESIMFICKMPKMKEGGSED